MTGTAMDGDVGASASFCREVGDQVQGLGIIRGRRVVDRRDVEEAHADEGGYEFFAGESEDRQFARAEHGDQDVHARATDLLQFSGEELVPEWAGNDTDSAEPDRDRPQSHQSASDPAPTLVDRSCSMDWPELSGRTASESAEQRSIPSDQRSPG